MTSTTLARSHTTARAGGLLRLAAAANVLAAGVPGIVLLVAPGVGAEQILGLETTDAATRAVATAMLGAIWTAVGLLSAVGLGRPALLPRLGGLFLLQATYKTLWVLASLTRIGDLGPVGVGLLAGFVVVIPLLAAAGRQGLTTSAVRA